MTTTTRKILSTSMTVAMALTLLSVGGCKKQETTPPTDASSGDDEADEADDEADEADEADDESDGPEPLTKASFDEAINDHMQEISDCYIAALETNDTLAGKLEAEFTFGADGVPTSVAAAEGSTLTDEGLVQCIAEAAKGWTFGVPKEEGMKMRYPFNLAPAG